MSWDLFVSIVDQVPDLARAVLHGVGERMLVASLARRRVGPSYAPIRPDPFSFRHRVSGASRLRRERDLLASSERVHRPLDRRASPPSSSFCRRRLARQKGPEGDVSAQRPEIGDNHTREMAAKTAFLLASYQLRVSEDWVVETVSALQTK
jgi:hypothetical protein